MLKRDSVPYGYKLVRKGRTGKKNRELYDLEIDPVAGSQVQLIFEMAGRQGMGTTRIANYLNEHFPDPNKTWTRATVMTMLKNPVYTGRMHMNDVLSAPNETLRLLARPVTRSDDRSSSCRVCQYPRRRG